MHAPEPITPQAELLIFAKQPRPGHVKTRLARSIGPTHAVRAYQAMLECVIARWRTRRALTPVLAVSPDTWRADAARRWPDLHVVSQGHGDLGQRLNRVTHQRWQATQKPMILIGADSPDLPETLMHQALDALAHGHAACAPTHDGGYCLLALPHPAPPLFEQIDWGSDRVARQTYRAARAAGLTLIELEPFCDVDTLDDLHALWQRTRASHDPHLRRLAEAVEPLLPGHPDRSTARPGRPSRPPRTSP